MTMAGRLLAAGLSAGVAVAAAATPAAGMDWPATLDTDLTAIDAAMHDSHPGLHDAHAPGFAAQLQDTLALARRRAQQVDSFAGYWWTLKGYTAAFNDGHVSLNALPAAPALPMRWPGFLTGFEGDAQIVMERAATSTQAPPLGAHLLSCDGVDAATLAAQRVGAFNGRWNLQASRIHAGGELLLDQGNPFVALPRRCRFRVDGQTRDITLQWRALDSAEVAAHLAATRRSFRPPNGLHALPGGGYWITTGSFNADPGQPNFAELTALLQTLDTQRQALQRAPQVVLDVRGNSGGASQWSIALARLVWSAEAVARVRDDSFVEWRTSQANIDQLRGFLQKLRNAPDAAPEMVRML
ncbi:MAG: hypothetical protein GAK31_00346 [Stenotrophomonas maltophilia]|uniref:Tail specific protease domain-containing protein n=1 Tax=Stenotrophomonas maltophilia TaxID=40324 RepID=A0A7V8FJC3_STEMA|nr:MAG: hypothetical protein GAK31_00346 [Stenotrophomonas maltophilia]